ncbi:MAG: hypothetical protein M1834_005401 [Cirrosporium novae-zelandiae]|nr:MAG: hypothetical protein M1834_005401 [Cirrosporium novae-zelandiae]
MSKVFIVVRLHGSSATGKWNEKQYAIDQVCASYGLAKTAANKLETRNPKTQFRVLELEVIGGNVTVEAPDDIDDKADPTNAPDYSNSNEDGDNEDMSDDDDIPPEGSPTCLSGLTLVFTGVLESMDRKKSKAYAERHGAKVTTSPSKNTSYVVIGKDAGPKKIEKIEKLGVQTITEKEFFDLIRASVGDEDEDEDDDDTSTKRSVDDMEDADEDDNENGKAKKQKRGRKG